MRKRTLAEKIYIGDMTERGDGTLTESIFGLDI